MKISIRVYDNARTAAPTFDRYTIVFHGRYRHLTSGWQHYLASSDHPFHPMGFGQHAESRTDIDTPSYRHLGNRLSDAARAELPDGVKAFIKQALIGFYDPEQYLIDRAALERVVETGYVSFPKIHRSRRGNHVTIH